MAPKRRTAAVSTFITATVVWIFDSEIYVRALWFDEPREMACQLSTQPVADGYGFKGMLTTNSIGK